MLNSSSMDSNHGYQRHSNCSCPECYGPTPNRSDFNHRNQPYPEQLHDGPRNNYYACQQEYHSSFPASGRNYVGYQSYEYREERPRPLAPPQSRPPHPPCESRRDTAHFSHSAHPYQSHLSGHHSNVHHNCRDCMDQPTSADSNACRTVSLPHNQQNDFESRYGNRDANYQSHNPPHFNRPSYPGDSGPFYPHQIHGNQRYEVDHTYDNCSNQFRHTDSQRPFDRGGNAGRNLPGPENFQNTSRVSNGIPPYMNGEQRYPAPHPIGGPTAHPGENITNHQHQVSSQMPPSIATQSTCNPSANMNVEQRYPAPQPVGGPNVHPGENIPNIPHQLSSEMPPSIATQSTCNPSANMNGEQKCPAPHPIGGPTAHPGEKITNLPPPVSSEMPPSIANQSTCNPSANNRDGIGNAGSGESVQVGSELDPHKVPTSIPTQSTYIPASLPDGKDIPDTSGQMQNGAHLSSDSVVDTKDSSSDTLKHATSTSTSSNSANASNDGSEKSKGNTGISSNGLHETSVMSYGDSKLSLHDKSHDEILNTAKSNSGQGSCEHDNRSMELPEKTEAKLSGHHTSNEPAEGQQSLQSQDTKRDGSVSSHILPDSHNRTKIHQSSLKSNMEDNTRRGQDTETKRDSKKRGKKDKKENLQEGNEIPDRKKLKKTHKNPMEQNNSPKHTNSHKHFPLPKASLMLQNVSWPPSSSNADQGGDGEEIINSRKQGFDRKNDVKSNDNMKHYCDPLVSNSVPQTVDYEMDDDQECFPDDDFDSAMSQMSHRHQGQGKEPGSTYKAIYGSDDDPGFIQHCPMLCGFVPSSLAELQNHLEEVHAMSTESRLNEQTLNTQKTAPHEDVEANPVRKMFIENNNQISIQKWASVVKKHALTRVAIPGNGLCFITCLLVSLHQAGITTKTREILGVEIMGELRNYWDTHYAQVVSGEGYTKENFLETCANFFQRGEYAESCIDIAFGSVANALCVNINLIQKRDIDKKQRIIFQRHDCTRIKSDVNLFLHYTEKGPKSKNLDAHYDCYVGTEFYKKNKPVIDEIINGVNDNVQNSGKTAESSSAKSSSVLTHKGEPESSSSQEGSEDSGLPKSQDGASIADILSELEEQCITVRIYKSQYDEVFSDR